MSMANYLENKVLDKVFRNVDFTVSGVYAKLHISDPGEDGTSGAAGETDRAAVTFSSAASGGAISNTADVDWVSVSTSETYTHISLWDASTAGNCLWTGSLAVSIAVIAGDDFTISTGNLDIALN